MSSVNYIYDSFYLTNKEYEELDNKFIKLCYKIVWELKRKNSKNNYTEDLDDVMQELRISIVKAGCYYKRQVYLEDCIKACKEHINDKFLLILIRKLEILWSKRTRHGANKQKFGEYQEKLLEKIISLLPEENKPIKNRPLKIDSKFTTYCKTIAWNRQKNLGKKITRERSIRTGMVSLSEFDHLGSI